MQLPPAPTHPAPLGCAAVGRGRSGVPHSPCSSAAAAAAVVATGKTLQLKQGPAQNKTPGGSPRPRHGGRGLGGGGSFKEQPGLLLPTHLPAASVPLQVTLLPRDCCCSRCRRCNLFPLGGPSLQHTLPWSLQCGQGKRCGEDWRGLPHTHTHSLRPRQVGATTTGTSQGSAKSDGAGSPLLPISSTCSAPPIRPPRDQTG